MQVGQDGRMNRVRQAGGRRRSTRAFALLVGMFGA